MSHSLLHQMRDFLASHSAAQRLVVGFSGGLDSSVLLRLLVMLRDQGRELRPVVAIHINHQLSERALEWQQHCQRECETLSVPLQVCRAQVVNRGKGLEDEARQQRYQAFAGVMQPGDALLLAHHRDDQAETLLLRLMRGAGPRGLAAMEVSRSFAQGQILRPLLGAERRQLENWAAQFDVTWVEDDSNVSEQFDRNYLRHQVMPLLAKRWPGFTARWQQSAQLCREADQQLQIQAQEDLDQLGLRAERWGWSLLIAPLQQLTAFRRGNLIRKLMEQLQLTLPDQVHLMEIERQMVAPRVDAQARVRWGDVSLRHFRGRLYVLPESAALEAPPASLQWHPPESLSWEGGELRVWQSNSGGLCLPEGASLEVGARQGGERCRPAQRRHSQTLKKLLQEYDLEPWLRDLIPIVRYQGDIVAVGDLWICAEYYRESGPGLRLSWQRSID